MKIFSEFKTFIKKGNVLDLAVGVIMGGAFGKIVASLVSDIIMPFIGLLLGGINLTEQKVLIRAATETSPALELFYGKFIQATIDFLLIAISVFVLIKMLNTFSSKVKNIKRKEVVEVVIVPEPEPTKEEILLADIRDILNELNSKSKK